MRGKHTLPMGVLSAASHPDAASENENSVPFQCYCGLGPACPFFNLMTPVQRAACSNDKRGTAQAYFKNGLSW